MSVYVSSLVWRTAMPATTKIVFLRLADFADDDGGNVYPSVARVAAETGVSERQVQRIYKAAIEDGLLIIESHATGGRGHTRRYIFNVSMLAAMAAERVTPCHPISGAEESDHNTLIEKGDTASPFSPQKGDTGDRKGDTGDVKGCQSLSPDSSLSVRDPSDGGDARARAERIEALRQRLCAIIEADDARYPGFAVGNDIRCWLADGATEEDVETAVRDVMARATAMPGSFAYFSKAVARVKAQREAGLPAPPPDAAKPHDNFTDRVMALMDRHYERGAAQ